MTKVKGSRQTSQSARDTLAALDVKRAQLLARGAELPELRRAAAFAAHVEKNAESRRVLDWVNSEVASYDSELASIDDAIAAAKNKILIAQAFEAAAADRARAREALEILVAFRKAGHDLDDALRIVGERGRALNDLVSKLHRSTNAQFPSWDQIDALGFRRSKPQSK
jgi:hypothetical protein